MFKSLLIANRGEIALRIVRACREMGIRAIAVYSEADALSPHVLEADEAVLIGPAPSTQSYLRAEALIAAARSSGAEAVHPGYGFLAEREPFARAVVDAGLVFVGPRPETIVAMGDKTAARRRMREAGVPIVPGGVDPIPSASAARGLADEIGYPVLLKAAAGGGGKGMRVVEEGSQVEKAFEAAAREATAAFGDGAVYLEKYLGRPRHIEIQVLGDASGKVLHLGERECSIQRRHQKLIEEAPSPVLTGQEREAMGAAAVKAAASVGYLGAGTVEFLYQDGDYFFLEMNTRLQVEHPVTELVTGLDLVEWQIRVAAGESLPFEQGDVRMQGHAIECRITSEDPSNGFLPSTGTIGKLSIPSGPGVRWDSGVGEGSAVGLHYDPLLAKLIVHAPTRERAIGRMRRALEELRLTGVATSAPFHLAVMGEADFQRGDLTIRYLEEHPGLLGEARSRVSEEEIAVIAALLEQDRRMHGQAVRPQAGEAEGERFSAWRMAGMPWTQAAQ